MQSEKIRNASGSQIHFNGEEAAAAAAVPLGENKNEEMPEEKKRESDLMDEEDEIDDEFDEEIDHNHVGIDMDDERLSSEEPDIAGGSTTHAS